VEAMADSAQQMVAKRDYDAFGNVISSTGTWGSAFGYAGGFGYQEDATGLKLLGHRYYDSSTGRFLTRDPIKDGRNWYSYGAGEGNPISGVDPTGKIWVAVIVVVILAVALCIGVGSVMNQTGGNADDRRDQVGKAFEEASAVEEPTELGSNLPNSSLGNPTGRPDSTFNEDIRSVGEVTVDGFEFVYGDMMDIMVNPPNSAKDIAEKLFEVISDFFIGGQVIKQGGRLPRHMGSRS
jgi:RHS repeat-associated protein